MFNDIPSALTNSVNIAKRCSAFAKKYAPSFPKFANTDEIVCILFVTAFPWHCTDCCSLLLIGHHSFTFNRPGMSSVKTRVLNILNLLRVLPRPSESFRVSGSNKDHGRGEKRWLGMAWASSPSFLSVPVLFYSFLDSLGFRFQQQRFYPVLLQRRALFRFWKNERKVHMDGVGGHVAPCVRRVPVVDSRLEASKL